MAGEKVNSQALVNLKGEIDLEQAKAKIKAEMDGNKSNPYIQYIGSYLLQTLESNPGSAEGIKNTDKTIAKSLDEMKKVAEKKKVGSMAILTPDEGFAVVAKYFGLGESVTAPVIIIPEVPISTDDFNINLEDFL